MAPRVLLVDDDRPVQAIVADVLTEVGCEVILAGNGAEALEQLRLRAPDVLITDLKMPVLDGWSLLRVCRTEPTLRHVPIVVITGEPAEEAKPLRELGIKHVVAKPFDIQTLLTAITGILGL